ncbi:hypothetical protein CR513_43784, partial [Mucuna pruriens]
MRVYGEEIPDNKVVDKILPTMPLKFDHVVTIIIESHNIDIITIIEKIKVNKEALKNQVNLNHDVESSQRGNYKGRRHDKNYQERIFFNCLYYRKFIHKVVDCRFKHQDENIWYLNTRCRNHMCGKKELFSTLDEMVKSMVKFRNYTNNPILEKDQVTIRLNDGSQIFISDIYWSS